MAFLEEVLAWRSSTPLPMRTLPQLLAEAADVAPRRVAIDFLGHSLTYRALQSLVDRAAQGLQTQGLKPGERVGLCLPNTPYFVIFHFAILKAGGIVVNYNPLYVERELLIQVRDSNTVMMVVPDVATIYEKVLKVAGQSDLRKLVLCPMAAAMPRIKGLFYRILRKREIARPAADPLHVSFKALINSRGKFHAPQIDINDVAVLQYTGGTTGTPKAAVLSHHNLCANSAQTVMATRSLNNSEIKVLGVLPLFHVFALTSVMHYAISWRGTMILLPRFEIKSTLATIQRTGPTVFPAVPTLYHAIAQAAPSASRRQQRAMRGIFACISGGAALPEEIKRRFEGATGCRLVEGYGLSECSPTLTVNPLDGLVKAGSAGQPLAATTIEIRDLADPHRLLPTGERGEVCARGPQVMQGYWNRAEETAATMIEGSLRTGDVGYLDADGYLFLVDRIKDLIVCSGYNVYPRMIEEALGRHTDVREATVIGVPDPYRGEAPKAFVALRAGAATTSDMLLDFLKKEISKIEMPREIEIRDALPRTPIGKLSKKELVAEEAERRASSNTYAGKENRIA